MAGQLLTETPLLIRPESALRQYQEQSVDFIEEVIRRARGCAALLRPGLGKTIAGLTAHVRHGIRRALVVAPAQVVETKVWSTEAASWEHTAHLRVVEVLGTPQERWLKCKLGADILVISYDNFFELTEIFRDKKLVLNNYFDAVYWDELSKMKHPGTIRFKRMRFWNQSVDVNLGFTGSPLGNHWKDIWGEMFTVAGEACLGPTQDEFLKTYFNMIYTGNSNRFPTYEVRNDGSVQEIKNRVRPYAFSISAKLAAQQLPEVVRTVLNLDVPPKARALEKKLRAELEVQLDSGVTLYALNQSKLGQLIRQFGSGAVYTNEERTTWEEVHDEKLRALQDRVDELQGSPILVFAWFRHSKERIARRFKGFEVFNASAGQVARWNRKQIPGLILNPAGSGLGLNLQLGSSDVFWFDPDWQREKLDQGDGRLARLGQLDPFVTSTICLCGALDRRIWEQLQEKGADEAELLESVALPDFY